MRAVRGGSGQGRDGGGDTNGGSSLTPPRCCWRRRIRNELFLFSLGNAQSRVYTSKPRNGQGSRKRPTRSSFAPPSERESQLHASLKVCLQQRVSQTKQRVSNNTKNSLFSSGAGGAGGAGADRPGTRTNRAQGGSLLSTRLLLAFGLSLLCFFF